MEEQLYFTIGELSKILDVPIRTLRYYDSIDLFSPVRTATHNNYRYYSIEQFELLNSIRFLRSHGFSIQQIKEHLAIKDTASFIASLDDQISWCRAERKRLDAVMRNLGERRDELKRIKEGMVFDRIEIIRKPERPVITLDRDFGSMMDLELNLRDLEHRAGGDPSIIIGRVGLTIRKDHICSNTYDRYNSIFLLQTGRTKKHLTSVFPAGEYVRVYVNDGNHSRSSEVYPEIMRFLKEHEYGISGDAIERVIIDSFITKDPSEFTTEIEIPVSPVV